MLYERFIEENLAMGWLAIGAGVGFQAHEFEAIESMPQFFYRAASYTAEVAGS